jgi:hypothetical protein
MEPRRIEVDEVPLHDPVVLVHGLSWCPKSRCWGRAELIRGVGLNCCLLTARHSPDGIRL